MKTTPRTPKILPWLAHKAGISQDRAETLWQAALCHAKTVTGEIDTPACWTAATDRLFELIAAESLREDAAAFGWRHWSRYNARMWKAPLQLLDALTLSATRNWQLLRPIQLG